jgi:phospholipase C
LHASGIPQIQHVIIIIQENRSLDSYFGTYPGANGIPIKNGKRESHPEIGNLLNDFDFSQTPR